VLTESPWSLTLLAHGNDAYSASGRFKLGKPAVNLNGTLLFGLSHLPGQVSALLFLSERIIKKAHQYEQKKPIPISSKTM